MTGKDPVVVLPAERFELPTNGLQKPDFARSWYVLARKCMNEDGLIGPTEGLMSATS